jgi:hypothetical protein
MSGIEVVRPGDIGFAMHVRPKGADLLILAGQMALGEPGYPHHVFVVTQGGSSPKCVEAMPNGAREVDIDGRWGADYVYLRPAYTEKFGGTFGIDVAAAARRYIDVPYSFADYAAIAGVHFGIKNGLMRRYVKASGHQICSQLADQALCDAGFHVYDDGRLPGDVTPSDLFKTLKAMPGTIELTA